MIISLIKKKKAFDKVKHPCMINALKKVGLEGTYLNIIKPSMKNPQLTASLMVKN